MSFRIIPAGEARTPCLPLLLLADESTTQVQAYYQTGDLFALDSDSGQPLAIVLTIPSADGSIELKAVAVEEGLHRRGVGTRVVRAVLGCLRGTGARRVIVGTGNSAIGPLAFYQKLGFRLWKIERDFFNPERGYPERMEEDGILCRDMVWMDLELQ